MATNALTDGALPSARLAFGTRKRKTIKVEIEVPAPKHKRPNAKGQPQYLKPFAVGNTAAVKKEKPTGSPTEALRRVLNQPIDKSGKTHAEHMAQVIVDKATGRGRAGDVYAFTAIADRVEGKPTQRVEGDLLGLNALADRLQKARQRKLKGAQAGQPDAQDGL